MNKPTSPPSLAETLGALDNLSAFAAASGIPRRTLERIKKAKDAYTPSTTTRMAVEAALKRHKPKMKEQA